MNRSLLTKRIGVLTFLAGLILSACAVPATPVPTAATPSAGAPATAVPTGTEPAAPRKTQTPVDGLQAITPGLPDQLLQLPAVVAARESLGKKLSLAPDQVQVISVEEVEWSDSCLGAGGISEMCLTVITPGYKILLSIQGQSYEVHTNDAGTSVRILEK